MDNPKILLIYPCYQSDVFTTLSLPVGLGYIAQSLEDNNIPYRIIDLNIDPENLVFNYLKKYDINFVGISMMSYKVIDSYKLANYIKSVSPKTKVIVGGPHVIAASTNIFNECPSIDILVVGEGEITILELVNDKDLSTIEGIIYKNENNEAIVNKPKNYLNINLIPFPKYSRFDLEKYTDVMPLNSSRGCIYNCTFCGAPLFLGNINRRQTAENMFKEFLYWFNHGYKKFNYTDSLFCLDKKRIISFCELIINGKYSVEFSAESVRADNINLQILEKMKKANFINISFGVESASNKMLKVYNKGETIEKIEEALLLTYKIDISVGLFFIIGGPGETANDVRLSFHFARKYPHVAFVYFFRLTPIPGTSYYKYAMEQGYIKEDTKYPTGNFGFEKNVSVSNDKMSLDEFNKILLEARNIEKFIRIRFAIRENLKKRLGLNINNIFFLNFLTVIINNNFTIKMLSYLVKRA